jgi:hypothetical protein
MNQENRPKKTGRASGDMPLPLTRLIHENFSLLMMYAYSQPALVRLFEERFEGEWKNLPKALFGYPIEKITRACLELGTLLRVLDDEDQLGDYLKQTGSPPLGRVVKNGQPDEPLYLRDMTNTLMHSTHFTWERGDDELGVKLICHSADPTRWKRAEIEMISLAELCVMLL